MATAWIDNQGDVWTEGDDGLLHSPETAPFTHEHVEKKWGPLRRIGTHAAMTDIAGVPAETWEQAVEAVARLLHQELAGGASSRTWRDFEEPARDLVAVAAPLLVDTARRAAAGHLDNEVEGIEREKGASDWSDGYRAAIDDLRSLLPVDDAPTAPADVASSTEAGTASVTSYPEVTHDVVTQGTPENSRPGVCMECGLTAVICRNWQAIDGRPHRCCDECTHGGAA